MFINELEWSLLWVININVVENNKTQPVYLHKKIIVIWIRKPCSLGGNTIWVSNIIQPLQVVVQNEKVTLVFAEDFLKQLWQYY